MEQQYEVVAELGAGVYGAATALKARDLRDEGRFVALLKGLRLQTGAVQEGETCQLQQLLQLMKLEHPNVVRLLDFGVDPGEGDARIAVVFELVNRDLPTYLGTSPHTPSHHIKEVMHQLLRGVHYLHDHGLEHHELTPRSVLVTASGRVKIAGWGLRRFLFDSASTAPTPAVSASWYRAPELLLLRVTCGPAADLWSVGCIFAEMFTRRPLFPGGSDFDQLTKIFSLLGVPSLEEWPLGASLPHGDFAGLHAAPRALAESMPEVGPKVGPDNENLAMALMLDLLTFSPRKRMSASVALFHPYFSEAAGVAMGEGTATSEGAATGEDEA